MRKRKPEELTDSGIEWIGYIPNAWDVSKLKYLARIISGQSPASESYNKNGDGTPFLQGNADFTNLYPSGDTYTSAGKKFSLRNDLLFSVRAPVGELNISDQRYSIGRGLCAIRPKGVDQKFLWYELQLAREDLRSISTGSTFESVSTEDLKNVLTVSPSIEEQKAIATFLDHKTQAIDQLIEKKQQLIEKLKEKRQALITRAVTKGLNPDAPMKDSGIEWLGEIPLHWKKTKLKYHLKVNGRIGYRGYTNEDLVEKGEGAITLGGKNINELNQLNLEDKTYLSWDKYYESPEIMVKKGDIVLAQRGTLGRSALVNKDIGDSTINPSLVLLNNIQINPEFLHFSLISNTVTRQINVLTSNTAVPMISQYQIENIRIALPPKNEIENIVSFIKSATKNIDDIISLVIHQKGKIQNYRQSLISAAVTGKIDVRD